MTWQDWAIQEKARISGEARWRHLRTFDPGGPVSGRVDGRELISFASNDYLGLSAHPQVVSAAHDALDRWGTGAGSARLIAGTRPIHTELEAALAEWKGTQAAVLLPSGYMANLAVVSALATPGTLVLSDALNHASIIDACRLARAETLVYPHLDLNAIERGLAGASRRCLVVSESVFSMDGDAAAVEDLVRVCERHGSLLVLDEAHAVLGPHAPESELLLRVGTLSKALGSAGGFIAGPSQLVELIVNRARPFIFTTAPAPAAAAAALAAIGLLRGRVGVELVGRLRDLVDQVRPDHPSPIVPLLLGGEEAALHRSGELIRQGFLVPAIRPPTVPKGTSRLRISLSAAHSDAQVASLVAALPELVGLVA